MKRFAILGAVLVLGAAAFYFVNDRLNLGIGKSHYVFNQKITLTFDTPNGPVVASNVGETSWNFQSKRLWDAKSGLRISYSGEALVAELSEDVFVFALVENNAGLGLYIADHNNWVEATSRDWRKGISFVDRSGGEVWQIPHELLPRLLTFDDVSDISSFHVLDPSDIGQTLGSGYALTSATFELTTDKVTSGVVEPLLVDWILATSKVGSFTTVIKTDTETGISHQISRDLFWGGAALNEISEKYTK